MSKKARKMENRLPASSSEYAIFRYDILYFSFASSLAADIFAGACLPDIPLIDFRAFVSLSLRPRRRRCSLIDFRVYVRDVLRTVNPRVS